VTIVAKIDHVYAVLRDAERAHGFMVDRLRLPVAWPFSSHGSFASGGVGLGNLNLEFIAAGPGWQPLEPARLAGIAFEPAIPADDALIGHLDSLGIGHSPLMPTPGWTNVALTDDALGRFAFICDYHTSVAKDAALRQSALDACDGGRLHVRRAAEVVVGTSSLEAARQAWTRLLGDSHRDNEDTWILGTGPALRLVNHQRVEVVDLVLDVANAAEAERIWAELGDEAETLAGLPLTFRSQ